MVNFNRYTGSLPFSDVVQGIWSIETYEESCRFPLITDGYPELVFMVRGNAGVYIADQYYPFQKIDVVGVVDKPFELKLGSFTRFVSVKLMPWALPAVINDRADLIKNSLSPLTNFKFIEEPRPGFKKNSSLYEAINSQIIPFLAKLFSGVGSSHPGLYESIATLYKNVQFLDTDKQFLNHGSKRYYQRLYKENVGLSPSRFKRLLKIKKASLLILRQREMQMNSLGLALGYFDQSHFNKDFIEFTGTTPYQYSIKAGHVPVEGDSRYISQYEYS